jgi:serine/threonine protein kinase
MGMLLTCPQGHQWEPAPGDSALAGDSLACPVCAAQVEDPPLPGEPVAAGRALFQRLATAPAASVPGPTVLDPLQAADRQWGGPSAAQAPGPPLLPAYEILAELGRGGMGVVYKARHRELKRLVALKMILAGQHAGEQELTRFRTEAEAVARLQHPHIVQIYEIGQAEGHPYLALELVAGGSLASQLNGTPWPTRPAAQLVETLARAIHYAHECGIVHRDLKPANILLAVASCQLSVVSEERAPFALTTDNWQLTTIPKITDFGLAKKLDSGSGQTASGAIMGTPSYMAPEQGGGHSKEVGPPTDVYAPGAILYELLTGRTPFKAASAMDTLFQVLSEEPMAVRQLQPKVPVDLETIALKCLQKEPGRRYATALDLAEDLRRFLAHESIQARPVGLLARAGRWLQRPERIRDAGLIMILHALVRTVVALVFLASCAAKIYTHTFDPEEGLVLLYVSGLGVINFWAGWRTVGKNLPAIWIGLGIALLYLGTKLPYFRMTWGISSDSEIVDPSKILNPVFIYTFFAVLQVIACVVALVAFQANRDALQRERGRGTAG